ncbi:reverse transcriptase domain-containing protein [Tanacetum coccineum]
MLSSIAKQTPIQGERPWKFHYSLHIGHLHINNALADLGASISLMPYTMYEKLGLGEPKPTRMSLELVDKSIQYPHVREDSKIPIILGRPFLATARAMIDVFNKKITLRVGNEEESIDLSDLENCGKANDIVESWTPIWRIDEINMPYSRGTERTDQAQNEYLYSASANEIDEKRLVLKDLPSYLESTYLKGDESCPVIISSKLTKKEKISLLQRDLQFELLIKRYKLLKSVAEKLKLIRFYFLDSFSGFFQILIAPEDQEKTTFTCPYGTFAYRRTPFGLCYAPATFQRCMMAIFHDMVEDFMEVFMDGFSVLEGIVLGHKMSGKGIKVDKAKIDVIAKLPYPSNVKGVRSFLGHAGFIDAKPRLIRWVLLLQGFNIEIKDKKGAENLSVDHLSRLENPNMGELAEYEIVNKFLDEHLMILKAKLNDEEPWYNMAYPKAYQLEIYALVSQTCCGKKDLWEEELNTAMQGSVITQIKKRAECKLYDDSIVPITRKEIRYMSSILVVSLSYLNCMYFYKDAIGSSFQVNTQVLKHSS